MVAFAERVFWFFRPRKGHAASFALASLGSPASARGRTLLHAREKEAGGCRGRASPPPFAFRFASLRSLARSLAHGMKLVLLCSASLRILYTAFTTGLSALTDPKS